MVPAGATRGRGRPEDQPPLLITPGDPAGIGPEVTAGALARSPRANVVVVGDAAALAPWLERAGLRMVGVETMRATGDPTQVAVFDPGAAEEPVEVAAVRRAVMACLANEARAVVTGPIHKEKLAARGFQHAGHTELLGELCAVDRPVMAFVGGRVQVVLVTVHHPLARVASLLTTEGVRHTAQTAHDALVEQLGLASPRLVVCGLNPHAGDGGVLGHEDADVIAPAVTELAAAGIDIVGPVSVETAFAVALRGGADMVVAMYHDQGLGPLKALQAAAEGGSRAVNWTLGLPIVRTSVDHGTASDIAGQGVADPAGMIAAIELGATLSTPADRRPSGYAHRA